MCFNLAHNVISSWKINEFNWYQSLENSCSCHFWPTRLAKTAEEVSRWSPQSSPTLRKDHDLEHDQSPNHKKSVIAKVKERAKKWRSNLIKKKHSDDSNTTPSWGVSLDDDEDEEDEEDPEYLGAPSNFNQSLILRIIGTYKILREKIIWNICLNQCALTNSSTWSLSVRIRDGSWGVQGGS